MNHTIKIIIAAGFMLGLQSAYAAPLTVPNSFTANTAASAVQVNANFTAAKTAVDDNDARITALDARLAALEAVTDTNNGVLTLQKAAGNWAIISNTFDSAKPGANFVELRREIVYGTMVINADGTFVVSFTAGNDLTIGLTSIGVQVSPTVTLFDQDVQYTDIVSTPFSSSGTFTATGNRITATIPAANMNLNGFISQNGQVMVMQGDNGGPNGNNLMIMVKIN